MSVLLRSGVVYWRCWEIDYLWEVLKSAIWGEKPPEEPRWNEWVHRSLSDNHCNECVKLNGCWFAKEKTPRWPHHPSCHCILKEIPYDDVLFKTTVECAYSKFDPFLFDVQQKYAHGKEKLFHTWGYTVADAEWLQHEIEKQGLANYTSGEYALGKLNNNGQHISIRIEIPRKDTTGTVSFITGWMVHPNGHIRLVTPYGGK